MEEELEKEIQRYNEEQDGDCRYVQTARHFARWMRDQMMKEAVEGEVIQDLKDVNRVKSFSKVPEWLRFGDKVKLIIVKEEE